MKKLNKFHAFLFTFLLSLCFTSAHAGAYSTDDHTVLLLHWENMTDSSSNWYTLTWNWWAGQITYNYKYWAWSLFTNWSSTHEIYVNWSEAMRFWAKDFTIDLWVYANGLWTYNHFLNDRDAGGWYLLLKNDWNIRFGDSGIAWTIDTTWAWITTGSWYHVAVVRSWTTLYIFRNWSKIHEQTVSSGALNERDGQTINIWAVEWHPSDRLHWYYDEVRLSKDVARWTSNFSAWNSHGANPTFDTTPPVGWGVSNYNWIQLLTNIDVDITAATDAWDWMSSDAADYLLEYDSATLTDWNCWAFSWSWTDAWVTEVTWAATYSFTWTLDNCYKFRYTYSDAAYYANTLVVTWTDITKVASADTIPPTWWAVSNLDGFQSSTTVAVNVLAATDDWDGMSSTGSDYLLEYDSATLTAWTCWSYSDSWTDAWVTEVTWTTSYNFTWTTDNCYKFRYTFADAAETPNTLTVTWTDITKISSGSSEDHSWGWDVTLTWDWWSFSLPAWAVSLLMDPAQNIDLTSQISVETSTWNQVHWTSIKSALNTITWDFTSDDIKKVWINSWITWEDTVITAWGFELRIPDWTNMFGPTWWNWLLSAPQDTTWANFSAVWSHLAWLVAQVWSATHDIVFDTPILVKVPQGTWNPYSKSPGQDWAEMTTACSDIDWGWITFPNECYFQSWGNTYFWTYHLTDYWVFDPIEWEVDTLAQLEIVPWIVTISAPDLLDFWTWAVSTSTQTVSIDLTTYSWGTQYFAVKDLRWSNSWYYTTLDIWHLTVTWTSKQIDAFNIYATLTWSNSGITKLDWLYWQAIPDEVVIPSSLTHIHINSALTVLERQSATTPDAWILWEYWIQPMFEINIPKYQEIWEYSGLMTYTLTEN